MQLLRFNLILNIQDDPIADEKDVSKLWEVAQEELGSEPAFLVIEDPDERRFLFEEFVYSQKNAVRATEQV